MQGWLLALGLAAATPAWSYTALVSDASLSAAAASPFETTTGMVGLPAATGATGGLGVAISPDGRTAYVVNAGATGATGQVTAIDLTRSPPSAASSSDMPGRPGNFIAISPDGTRAYMTDPRDDLVIPIDLSASHATPGAPIAVGRNPEGVAFSPDGRTVYVAENAATSGTPAITPIAVATNTPGTAITGLGPHPFSIAITPDGTRAYAGDAGSGTDGKVYPVALPAGTVGSPIAVGSGVTAIAISPDGRTAYAAGGTLTAITVPGNLAGTPIPLPGGAFAVAVTPDGRTAYVTNDAGSAVTPVDTATSTAGLAIAVTGTPRGIAITPDQAPVASFTVASGPPGSATRFDATASTVRFGTIARYDWVFGDGATLPNGGPSPSHVYGGSGRFTAAVTETDGAGTSLGGEVFTGQTASRVGAPTAMTTRSVVIGSAPAPAVTLSASTLDFASVPAGQSAARGFTITDSGSAPLRISSSALSGLGAGAFALTSDGCTATTLNPGASCAVSARFAPLAAGAFTATLAFTDDASGSPHTLSLNGTGVTDGSLTGRVIAGDQAGRPGVAGATIVACRAPGNAGCRQTTAGPTGGYGFGGLSPGPWRLEVTPPTPTLIGSTAVLAISPGVQTQDFVLHRPAGLASGVLVSSAAGSFAGGVPVIYWDGPFTISHQLVIPSPEPAGTVVSLVSEDAIYTDVGGYGAQTGLTATFRYDARGQPQLTAVGPGPPAGAGTGTGTGASLASRRPAGSGVASPLGHAAQGGLRALNIFDQLGQVNQAAGGSPNVTVQTTGNVNQSVHGPVTVSHQQYAQPIGFMRDPNNPALLIPICPAGTHVEVVDITLVPYGRPIPQRECVPNPPNPPQPQNGNAYIDPSGLLTTTAGFPLAGATITLQRSPAAGSPFLAPAPGSPIMRPSVNPEHTNSQGRYGWDVIPGRYRVRAEHGSCTVPGHPREGVLTSRVVTIPPAVTDLNLKLACPRIRRNATVTRLSATRLRPAAGRLVLLRVSVGARRGRAQAGTIAGVLILRAGRRTLGRIPLDARTGTAALTVAVGAPATLIATYSGDAYFAASGGRVRVS